MAVTPEQRAAMLDCLDELMIGSRPDLADCSFRDLFLTSIFIGEDSGTTDTNRYNLSLGNGNEHVTLGSAFGWGVVLPRGFEVQFVTIGARINPANGSQYRMTRSVGGAANTLLGPVLAMPGNTLAQTFPVNETLNAGDVVNIWTVEGGATDVVGSIWGVWL